MLGDFYTIKHSSLEEGFVKTSILFVLGKFLCFGHRAFLLFISEFQQRAFGCRKIRACLKTLIKIFTIDACILHLTCEKSVMNKHVTSQ